MQRSILLLLMLFFLCPAMAMGTEVQDVEVLALSTFIQTKTQETETLLKDIDVLRERLEQSEPTLNAILEKARERVHTFELVSRMARSNPYDMRVALAEVKYVQTALNTGLQPLETLKKDVAAKVQTGQDMAEGLERKWTAAMNATQRKEARTLQENADAANEKLKMLQGRLDAFSASVTEVQTKVSGWITDFESQLTEIWKESFLEKKSFRLLPEAGQDNVAVITTWYGNVKTFFAEQCAAITDEPGWGGTFVLFWLPFILVSIVAFRRLSPVFQNTHAGDRVTAAVGILCLSLGLSLLAAFFSDRVRQTSLLLFCAHVFTLVGVQILAWIFRNVRGVLTRRSLQPLWPLGMLSISVALLNLLRLPQWMDHLAWVGLLVLSSLFLGVIRPELRYERIVRSLHPYVLVLLVILAVLGWSKLAVLASMLWGVTTLAVQLALGSISVVNVVFERMDKTGLRALAADLGKTVLTLLIVLIAFLGVMAWITVNLGTSAVFDRLSTLELSWGNFSLNFLRLGAVILLFQLVRSLITVWKTVLEDDRLRWKNIDHGAAASLQRIGMYCLWLLFGLISLNLLGISLTSFAVIAGGLSVGIGFGMQTIISNFISGLILLFDRAMQPGDVIEVDGVWGRVVSVNIRNTEVQTYDNAKIFVPNSTLIANNLTNWTHRNDMRMRKDLPVGVAYGSDVAQVKKLLLEAAETHPAVLTKPAPVVFFNDFGPNSLSFMLRFWIRHVDFVVSAPSEIREAIDRSFREHGIEMPFPQMDIHMRSNDDMAMRFNAAEKHPDTAVGPNKT